MSKLDGWFKSSFSGNNGCVQVNLRESVQVRDSKDPAGAVLRFTDREWIAFVAGVRSGEFDLPRRPPQETDPAY
jgi:hypothetical protein